MEENPLVTLLYSKLFEILGHVYLALLSGQSVDTFFVQIGGNSDKHPHTSVFLRRNSITVSLFP